MKKKLGLALSMAGMAVQAVSCWVILLTPHPGAVLDRIGIARIEFWFVIGLLPLLVGLALVSQAKGRSAGWALFGLLGIIGGLLVLVQPKVGDREVAKALS
jgi:hypothetical protein